MIHPGVDVVCDLVQCFPLDLLSLEQLAHHIGEALHVIMRSSLSRLCSLLINRLFLAVELSILSWVKDKGSSLIAMRPLVSIVLTLIALSFIVWFRGIEQVGIVPHVRVRVIVLELPSLPIHITHFMLILSRLICL